MNVSTDLITPADSMILAFAQLIQPASIGEVYKFAQDTELSAALTLDEFTIHFQRLARARYLWRAIDEKYVVTPAGEAIALRSLLPKTRDKLRLLILNRARYGK